MKRIKIQGLDKTCTQLILGCAGHYKPHNYEWASGMLDAYVKNGGNTLDMARHYSGSEQTVGRWIQERGNREQIVILTKGAHHDDNGPRVNPQAIRDDIFKSLEMLQTDYIDLYALHRDDQAVPVGPIMEALNEQLAAGRVKAIGASNWTLRRIQEANEYASAHGLVGFTFNSPNLSLAKPNEPMWPGCVSADDEACAWHEHNQFPLLSWSSQAGGFFTGLYAPDKFDNEDMVRVYYSEANWERYRRAGQLAKEKGCTTIDIALAYVVNQPFPIGALIGPAKLEELESSVRALQIQLSRNELDWLNLKS